MTSLNKSKIKNIILDTVAVVLAAVIYALAINTFVTPMNINVGGATGIATVINALFNVPIGIMIIAINIPLMLLAWKVLGFAFIAKSAIGVVAISVAVEVVPAINFGSDDILLYCIFGGAIMGLGLGLFYVRGFSCGGSDFVVWMLKKKYRHISTGMIYLAVDAAVVIISSIVSKSIEIMLYSVIAIYVSQKVIDLVLSLGDNAEMVYIISDKFEAIANCITTEFDKGVTLIYGRGYYSGAKKNIILCALYRNQYYPLLTKVKEIDKNAFVISAKASRVTGEGFKPIEEN